LPVPARPWLTIAAAAIIRAALLLAPLAAWFPMMWAVPSSVAFWVGWPAMPLPGRRTATGRPTTARANGQTDYRQGNADQRDNRSCYGGVYVQDNNRENESDYWGVGSYDDFGADFRHISDNIQRGRENGFYTSYQARSYYQQLQAIRTRADYQQRTGRFNPDDIEMRLTSLRQPMHASTNYAQGRDNRGNRN